MARYELLPEQCRHELLTRIDRLAKEPISDVGELRSFMVCSECGAILYLRLTPLGIDTWPRQSEG
jgi:hypothetical protein